MSRSFLTHLASCPDTPEEVEQQNASEDKHVFPNSGKYDACEKNDSDPQETIHFDEGYELQATTSCELDSGDNGGYPHQA
jgi:hypothetical protein